MSDSLSVKLKTMIVEGLRLSETKPEDIADEEPLIGGALNLDSIDALELIVRLEKEFDIKISNSEESRAALANIKTLAAFVRQKADPERLSA